MMIGPDRAGGRPDVPTPVHQDIAGAGITRGAFPNMPRPTRAGGPTALAIILSLIAPIAGCGGGNADEVADLGGGPIIRPAEPGQAEIPDPDSGAPTGVVPDAEPAEPGSAEVPILDGPEDPGIGS
jgi:hypothetical protein